MVECKVTKLYGRHVLVRATPIEHSGGIITVSAKRRDDRGNMVSDEYQIIKWVVEAVSDEVAADHPEWTPGTLVVVAANPKRYTRPNPLLDEHLVIVKDEDVVGLASWEDTPVIVGATNADVAAVEASKVR